MDQNGPLVRKGFVARHARVLTFIGALIVFGTFVVKEGFREHLRSISESTNNSESIFLIRTDINELPIYLAYLNTRLGKLESIATTGTKTEAQPTLDKMRETVDLMRANMERANTSVDNLSRVFERLGYEETIQTRLEEVKTSVATLNSRKELVNNRAIELNSQKSDDAAKINWIIAKADEVSGEYTSLRFNKVVPLGKDMLELAESQRKKYEHFYDQATWLSYVLYALGWGMGLIGRIYGLETGEVG